MTQALHEEGRGIYDNTLSHDDPVIAAQKLLCGDNSAETKSPGNHVVVTEEQRPDKDIMICKMAVQLC